MKKGINLSVIRCENLRFSRQGTEVLHGINFTINEGGIVGLLGKNGAGKTTTINLLMGFLSPDSGDCHIYDAPSDRLPASIRADVGLLHEGFIQYNFMTIAEVERYYSRFYSKWKADVFWDLVGRMQIPSSRRIARLSCGQRSQVTLGLLLAQQASVLILDDFSLGLDVGYRRLFLEFLRDYVQRTGATVLLTSHVVSELEDFLDHVIVIQKGDILCNCSREAFLQRYRGYQLPRNEATMKLKADGRSIINIDHGANTINLYSELDPRAMQAYLSGTPAADTLSALKEIPLGFEDTFVGLTGRY